MNWLRRLIVGDHTPQAPELDEREDAVVEAIARASGRTVEDVRREQRRRAMHIEVDSMRRQ